MKTHRINGKEVAVKVQNVAYGNKTAQEVIAGLEDRISRLELAGGGNGLNPYRGKVIATLGDSFSAPNFWQAKMCAELDAINGRNGSLSGGTWVGTNAGGAYSQAQSLVTYYANLDPKPDYILCLFGTNDVNNNVTIGSLVNSQTIGSASGDINPSTSVTGGAQAALIVLKTNFPNAVIKIGYTPAGHLHDSFEKMQSAYALCDQLKKIAIMYGVSYIETRALGISPFLDADDGYESGGHPTGAGQTRIGEYMAKVMLGIY